MMIFSRRTRHSRLHPSLGGPRRRQSRGGVRPLGPFLWLLVAALVAGLLFFRPAASGLLWRALAPLSSVAHGIASGVAYAALPFSSKAELQNEITALRAELMQAQAQSADRAALAAENRELQKALGRNESVQKTLAAVVSRPPKIPYDALMLDAGTKNRIAAGDIVGIGAVVLGRIDEVSGATSRATLLSTPDLETSAIVAGSVPVILRGEGGGGFSAEVPQQTPVAIGDTAALPGVDGVIAAITSIDSQTGKSYETLHLASPVSFFALANVEIWSLQMPQTAEASTTP